MKGIMLTEDFLFLLRKARECKHSRFPTVFELYGRYLSMQTEISDYSTSTGSLVGGYVEDGLEDGEAWFQNLQLLIERVIVIKNEYIEIISEYNGAELKIRGLVTYIRKRKD